MLRTTYHWSMWVLEGDRFLLSNADRELTIVDAVSGASVTAQSTMKPILLVPKGSPDGILVWVDGESTVVELGRDFSTP